MVKAKQPQCRNCQECCVGVFCGDECKTLHERLTAKNRKGCGRKIQPAATVAPEPSRDRPEPCVLHGMLTADDVKELERRWVGMEDWRLVKPVSEPEVAQTEVA